MKKALNLCLAAGALNIVWFILCTPQQFLTVLVRNHLGGSPITLGILVGGINLAGTLNLASVVLIGVLGERRMVWFWTVLGARLCAFPVALAAFMVAAGGSKPIALIIVVVASILASIGNSLGGTAWWAWMGDLIPDSIRARFFGRRSSVIQAINMSFFFLATLFLDSLSHMVFVAYGILYLIAGIAGIVEVLTQLRVKDPNQGRIGKLHMPNFLIPLKDKEFRRFSLAVGAFLFSMNLVSPFLAPFVVDPKGAGASQTWLGINFVISQGTWVIVVPLWGYLMDRIGRRAVVVVGGFFVLCWIPYLFMGPQNFGILLIVSALISGLLAPAYWEGIAQLMITLSKADHRAVYAGWFWTWFGFCSAFSPLVGGALYELASNLNLHIGVLPISPIQMLVVLSIVLACVSQIIMSTVKPISEDSNSIRILLGTITKPGIFRAIAKELATMKPGNEPESHQK